MSIAGTPVTFEQMRDRSCAAANALVGIGVGRGDTVALFTATCPEWVYFWLGAARIGAVTAAVNVANKDDFLVHALRLSRAKVIITDAERHPRLLRGHRPRGDREVDSGRWGFVDRRVGTRIDEPTGRRTVRTRGPGGAVLHVGYHRAVESRRHDVALPVLRGRRRRSPRGNSRRATCVWTAMPLFHLSAAPSVLAPMLVGATTVLSAAFRPSEVWDELRACGATGFAGAGAMVSMIWNQPPDPRDSQLPLRFISAAPISADLYRGIEQRYATRVVTMYGMTEAFPIAYKTVSEDGVPGTSGQVNAAFEVRIVDVDRRALPAGAVGEITCRPTSDHVMSIGYVDPEAIDSRLRIEPHQEWFRTGDLGSLDDDGNLTYVDRVKDSLRRRGENVSSVEVETTVMRHPAVLEAAAVAIPSDLGEDDILVVVTLATGRGSGLRRVVGFLLGTDAVLLRSPVSGSAGRHSEERDRASPQGRAPKEGSRAQCWDREQHGYILSR